MLLTVLVHTCFYAYYNTCTESAVATVVRCWALDQRVAGSNPGWVAVYAFMGKMLNPDCLSQPREYKLVPVRVVHEYL